MPIYSRCGISNLSALLLVLGCAAGVGTAKCEPSADPSSWPGADLFSKSVVWQIQIEITPRDLENLRRETRTFVHARVAESGTHYADVALRLKGSVGSFRPVDEKPGFTLDFARFSPAQKFHGLRRIHLNNSVEDPSYSSELIASELFHRADIPAPRVSRATVTLNGRPLGLYVLKEGFTEDFLSCYFKSIGGNLFEPGEGHDVNQHLKRVAIRAPTRGRSVLKALSDTVLDTDPTRLWQRLGAIVDLDRFVRFIALEVILGHRDGYCLARNNFRIYQDVSTDKLVFIPDGMDQLFGKADLPWMPHMAGLVAQAVMKTPEGRDHYSTAFRALFETVFKPEVLTGQLNQDLASLSPVLRQSEIDSISNQVGSFERKILERHRFLQAELDKAPLQVLEFKEGISHLAGWNAADKPVLGQMANTVNLEGVKCLQIRVESEASPSWRTKALLGPGRYRFEGRVRLLGVKPLGFGIHQGAGLRTSGQTRESDDLIGTSGWQVLTSDFEIQDGAREVEFICELRASAGEAWFDCSSLQVKQRP